MKSAIRIIKKIFEPWRPDFLMGPPTGGGEDIVTVRGHKMWDSPMGLIRNKPCLDCGEIIYISIMERDKVRCTYCHLDYVEKLFKEVDDANE